MSTSFKDITARELEWLAIGANVLGSGGGGDPAYDLLIAQEMCAEYGPARLLAPQALHDDDLILPIGFMGAPMVCMEKLPSGHEFTELFPYVEQHFGRSVSAIFPFEVGGSNALVPFEIASRLQLPVVDGDIMGRAFPHITMNTCALAGLAPAPAFIADALGNCAVVYPKQIDELERMLRALTIAMGASAAVVVFPLRGAQARELLFHHTLSEAILMGQALSARDPDFFATHHVTLLAEGVIHDIDQQLVGGFLKGHVLIISANDRWTVHYQNEYLVVECQGIRRAATPDVIVIFDSESGLPLPVERLRYGLRVQLATLPGRKLWKTPAGLDLVGPHVFGYD